MQTSIVGNIYCIHHCPYYHVIWYNMVMSNAYKCNVQDCIGYMYVYASSVPLFRFLVVDSNLHGLQAVTIMYLTSTSSTDPLPVYEYQIKWPTIMCCTCIIISPNTSFGDIMVLASPPRPPVDPDDVNSFKFYMRVDTPLRYFAIEIWYPPMTRPTAFTAKWHSYPPNLQNAISP